MEGSGASQFTLEVQFCFYRLELWASYLASFCFSFLFKVGVTVMVGDLWGQRRVSVRSLYSLLCEDSRVPGNEYPFAHMEPALN